MMGQGCNVRGRNGLGHGSGAHGMERDGQRGSAALRRRSMSSGSRPCLCTGPSRFRAVTTDFGPCLAARWRMPLWLVEAASPPGLFPILLEVHGNPRNRPHREPAPEPEGRATGAGCWFCQAGEEEGRAPFFSAVEPRRRRRASRRRVLLGAAGGSPVFHINLRIPHPAHPTHSGVEFR